MIDLGPDLERDIAEYPNSFGPLGPGDERIETARYTLCMGTGKSWNTVQRQRFSEKEVDQVLEEVRASLRERGRSSTQWEIGSAAQPRDLPDLLLKRGLVPDREPSAIALVLREAPEFASSECVGRRVETFEEYVAANEVQHAAFGVSSEDAEKRREALRERWRNSPNIMHAVWRGGEIIGAGLSAPTGYGLLLYGGATRPEARGRGAYRALLRARWEEAVARGTPALFTQAGAMSFPILHRLGFQRVGHIRILLDEFGSK